MKKEINSDRIIEITLQIVEETEGVNQVNFREIARRLGCAHTNLYNYFDSLDDILWTAQEAIQKKISHRLETSLEGPQAPEEKFKNYFKVFLDAYLLHKGWFYLAWMKYKGTRPKSHFVHTEKTVDVFLQKLAEISSAVFKKDTPTEKLRIYLHDIHCYLHGEVSIFLAGRGLISDPGAFEAFVLEQCTRMLKFMVINDF